MLDIKKTKRAFQKYIQQFDINDDKIKLKLIHTYQVVDIMKYLCQKENISHEDTQLALVIALLHDIGRFEQLKRFHSFSDENIDHAKLGVEILFKERMIEAFVEDRQYDQLIYYAILYHSLYNVPPVTDKRTDLHVRLIRDSDKLDNFRVKNEAAIPTLFDISQEDFLKQTVSEQIMNQIRNHQLILKSDRKNEMDMWVSYFAFIFDLNFSSSYQYLKDTDYIRRNMRRFLYQGHLQQQMNEIEQECINYIEKKLISND